jgi:hemerythrin-like metal-binding protein
VPDLTWNDSFALGLPEIDRQHQKLFELLDDLDRGVQAGNGTAAARHLFAELSSYSRYHFSAEENLMRTRGWSNLGDHAALHREFMQWLDTVAPTVGQGDVAAQAEVRRFLRSWLVRHVGVADRLAWAAMKQQGLV